MRGVEETAPGRDGLGDTPGARAKPRRFTSDMLEQLSAIDQDVTEVMAAEADRDAAVVQHTQLLTKAQVTLLPVVLGPCAHSLKHALR